MPDFGRRVLLKAATVAAGGLAIGRPLTTSVAAASSRAAGLGTLNVRWAGGGVVELATPTNKTVAYVDAWVWNNRAYSVLKVGKPAELSSAQFKDSGLDPNQIVANGGAGQNFGGMAQQGGMLGV